LVLLLTSTTSTESTLVRRDPLRKLVRIGPNSVSSITHAGLQLDCSMEPRTSRSMGLEHHGHSSAAPQPHTAHRGPFWPITITHRSSVGQIKGYSGSHAITRLEATANEDTMMGVDVRNTTIGSIEKAISVAKHACNKTPYGHSDRTSLLRAYGSKTRRKHLRTREMDDLEQFIQTSRSS